MPMDEEPIVAEATPTVEERVAVVKAEPIIETAPEPHVEVIEATPAEELGELEEQADEAVVEEKPVRKRRAPAKKPAAPRARTSTAGRRTRKKPDATNSH